MLPSLGFGLPANSRGKAWLPGAGARCRLASLTSLLLQQAALDTPQIRLNFLLLPIP